MNVEAAVKLAVPLVFDAEGCRLTAYLDALVDRPLWTIGHGTTLIGGLPVPPRMVCTREQADEWAAADLTAVAAQIEHVVRVPLNAPQLAALISFVYNCGTGHFEESSVLTALNLGEYQHAADRLLEYDHAGGARVSGLTSRRARERALFMTSPVTAHHERRQHDAGPPHGVKERRRPRLDPPRLDPSAPSQADALNEQEIEHLDLPPPPQAA